MGRTAFVDEEARWFHGVDIVEGDWIVFRPSDGWGLTIGKQMCRMLSDVDIRGRVDEPERIF